MRECENEMISPIKSGGESKWLMICGLQRMGLGMTCVSAPTRPDHANALPCHAITKEPQNTLGSKHYGYHVRLLHSCTIRNTIRVNHLNVDKGGSCMKNSTQ